MNIITIFFIFYLQELLNFYNFQKKSAKYESMSISIAKKSLQLSNIYFSFFRGRHQTTARASGCREGKD